MPSESFLIAHKVRGEAVFDVAIKMTCPICGPRQPDITKEHNGWPSCTECESEGFWWIIPTSGHRARPFWHIELFKLQWATPNSESWTRVLENAIPDNVPSMPEGWPDHYPTRVSSPVSAASGEDLLKELNL